MLSACTASTLLWITVIAWLSLVRMGYIPCKCSCCFLQLFLRVRTISIDLALPLNGSIDRYSPSWSTNLLDQYIATINAFKGYDNVLAYNVGNEVVIQNTTSVAPFVKAAARDTKAYLWVQNIIHSRLSSVYRQSIGSSALVGYAAIDGDDASFVVLVAEFLSCGSNATSIDLFGLNN